MWHQVADLLDAAKHAVDEALLLALRRRCWFRCHRYPPEMWPARPAGSAPARTSRPAPPSAATSASAPLARIVPEKFGDQTHTHARSALWLVRPGLLFGPGRAGDIEVGEGVIAHECRE